MKNDSISFAYKYTTIAASAAVAVAVAATTRTKTEKAATTKMTKKVWDSSQCVCHLSQINVYTCKTSSNSKERLT